MSFIQVLDESTINQIAAGEVVERPSAVVKELVENAMDAEATAVTVEIKEGGLSFIRITDNGAGIEKDEIPLAFLRHATSKIRTAEDLLSVTSLGFRGEALSSIASVAQVELITKTPSSLNGYRYLIEGGEEKALEEIGSPGGTTIIVRNLFFNTPARRKFLKSAMTEAGYISDLMERLMVSHPNVSFKFIMNNQIRLQSSGNNSSKDILYHVYGRDIAKELLPLDYQSEKPASSLDSAETFVKITGYIGKPTITRGNRNFENYFINGRYIKSTVITKAIEEAYKPFLMRHKYPFTSIYFEIDPAQIDVNVHPQKLEIRLKNSEEIFHLTIKAIRETISGKSLIPKVILTKQEEIKESEYRLPEPFEDNRRKQFEVPARNTQEEAGRHNNIPERIKDIPSNMLSDHLTENSGVFSKSKEQIVLPNSKEQGIIPNSKEQSIISNSKEQGIIPNPKGQGIIPNSKEQGIIPNSKEQGIIPNSKEQILYEKNNNSELNVLSESTEPSNYEFTVKNPNQDSFKTNDASQVTEPASPQEFSADVITTQAPKVISSNQINLFDTSDSMTEAPFLSKKALEDHRIIGQVFSTYWLVEYKKELYIIDQHAAHEKVLYERIMSAAKNKTYESQQLLPPIVLTLTLREQEVLKKQEEVLMTLGYEFEHFGGHEYSVRAVPADLYSISEKELLLEFIDNLTDDFTGGTSGSLSILERVASLSCKAAVKANHIFSVEEAQALINELLTLENPYNCPHGRPVIISMSQYELERKFKRVL